MQIFLTWKRNYSGWKIEDKMRQWEVINAKEMSIDRKK